MIEHTKGLSTLTALDLSSNKIEAVAGLAPLTKLVNLSLRRNLVRDLGGVRDLRSVTELDLAENRLETFEQLAPLAALRASPLRELTLSGNPVCSCAGYRDRVRGLLPLLAILDGRAVGGVDDALDAAAPSAAAAAAAASDPAPQFLRTLPMGGIGDSFPFSSNYSPPPVDPQRSPFSPLRADEAQLRRWGATRSEAFASSC